jgi:hypothetical protein
MASGFSRILLLRSGIREYPGIHEMEDISKMDWEAGVKRRRRLAADIGTAQGSIALKPRYSSESKHLNGHTAKPRIKKEERRCTWIDRSEAESANTPGMKGCTTQLKAVGNGNVVENKIPGSLRNRRTVDADMKVWLTRVGQMTSPGMSRCLRRPRIL